jgi:hypothetical protein
MTRTTTAIREFLRPGSIRRPSLAPLEAGLRPNSRLDEASVVLQEDGIEADDVVWWHGGLIASAGNRILRRGGTGGNSELASFEGPVTAIRLIDEKLVVAIEGFGIMSVDAAGTTTTVCSDERVRQCVTDLQLVRGTSLADGQLIVCVGSIQNTAASWSQGLVSLRSNGQLISISHSNGQPNVNVIVDGLAWPSGVAKAGPNEYLVSLSLAHRVERRTIDGTGAAASASVSVLENLPGYPGRIRERENGGWWIAMPYLRNRATELILSEDALRADMLANVHPDVWLVPQLRSENVYRDPLQIGQQRVMGVIKPWAPPRSYGLAFRLDPDGRIVESAHSRPDGDRKGVTGIAPSADGVFAACRGARVVVKFQEVER